ncbi:MAG: hypothetical protein U0744_06760 [Gemmataceae bacterium]
MKAVFAFALTASLLVSMGCEKGTGKVSVSGSVTYKDQKLNWGRVRFFNAKNEEVGTSTLNRDGTFVATDLPLEELKVALEIDPPGTTPSPKAPPGTPVIAEVNPRPEKVVEVPAKYKKADTTPTTVKITGGNQKIDLKLD